MVSCQNCGSEVEDGAKFCRNCGSEIVPEEHNVSGTKFCANCGFEMSAVGNADKSPVLAAILSFLIVGLGQIYLGLTKKGIILFVAAIVSGILMLVLIGWITWLIVWGYAIYDAYNSGEKMNRGIAVADTIDFNNL